MKATEPTCKEGEILEAIAQGKTLKAIADDLGISLSAVAQRLRRARRRYGAKSNAQAAVLWALSNATVIKPPSGPAPDPGR